MRICQPLQEGGYKGLKIGTLVGVSEQDDGAGKGVSSLMLRLDGFCCFQ